MRKKFLKQRRLDVGEYTLNERLENLEVLTEELNRNARIAIEKPFPLMGVAEVDLKKVVVSILNHLHLSVKVVKENEKIILEEWGGKIVIPGKMLKTISKTGGRKNDL